MNQDILVFAIILTTISYAGYSFFKNLKMKKEKSNCNGCTGCELTQKINCDC